MTLPKGVEDVLRVVAPVLAGALTGPLGPLAATIAATALDAWLGPAVKPADGSATVPPAAIVQAVQQNGDKPDFLLAVRQAELNLQRYEASLGFRFADLEQKDRSSARVMVQETGLAKAQFIAGMGIVCLSMLFLLGIVAGCISAMTGHLTISPANVSLTVAAFGLLGTVTGAFQTISAQILAFYFGSSAASAKKSDQISDAMTQMGRDLGDAAKAAPPTALPAPAPVVVVPAQPAPAQDAPTGPSRFIDLIEKLLDHEGGYVDNPDDPGRCTNMGITLATLRDWRHDPGIGCDAVSALTRDQAKEIYFTRYWNGLCCDSLPAGVDYEVFDFGVNAGIHRSAKLLQIILAKRDPSLKIDGVIGPLTLAVLDKASARALVEEFHAGRMAYYRGLDIFAKFGPGWTRRADAVLADSLVAAKSAAVAV